MIAACCTSMQVVASIAHSATAVRASFSFELDFGAALSDTGISQDALLSAGIPLACVTLGSQDVPRAVPNRFTCIHHSTFHSRMQDTWLVAPAKDSSQSFAALSALAHALERQKSGLLARFLPRANAEVGIGFLTPHFAHVGGPANDFEGLVMNMLPFEEDYKWATFASFEAKEKLLPSKAEVAAMGALIDARSLDTGGLLPADPLEKRKLATSAIDWCGIGSRGCCGHDVHILLWELGGECMFPFIYTPPQRTF